MEKEEKNIENIENLSASENNLQESMFFNDLVEENQEQEDFETIETEELKQTDNALKEPVEQKFEEFQEELNEEISEENFEENHEEVLEEKENEIIEDDVENIFDEELEAVEENVIEEVAKVETNKAFVSTIEDFEEEKIQEAEELITVRPVKFQEFEKPTQRRTIKKNLDILQDISMHVSVELGRTKSSIKEVMDMTKGSIVELDKIAGEQVEIFVNEKLVAKGEVIVIEDQFGVRVTSTNIVKEID